MKTSYLIKRLLRPIFLTIAVTLSSASLAFAEEINTNQATHTAQVNSSSSEKSYGTHVTNSAMLGTISSDSSVTMEATGLSSYYAIGLQVDDGASVGTAAGTYVLSATNGAKLVGVQVTDKNNLNETTSNITTLNGDYTIVSYRTDSSKPDVAMGLFNREGASIGTVDATFNVSNANTDAYGITSDEGASIDKIAGTINVTVSNEKDSLTDPVDGWAYGITSSGGAIGDIDAQVTVKSYGDGALGLSLDDGCQIGTIDGTYNIYALNGDAYGIELGGSKSLVKEISGDFTVATDKEGLSSAYGVYQYGGATINSISGDFDVDSGYNSAFGVYNEGSSTIIDISGSFKVDANEGWAVGVKNEYSTINSMTNTTIVVNCEDESAIGIENYDGAKIGSISGSITAKAYANTYGINNNANSIITSINANINVTSDDSWAVGVGNYNESKITSIGTENSLISADGYYAAAISNESDSDIGSITGSLKAQGTSSSYGVYNFATIGTIDASIESSSTSGTAYGINNKGTITGETSGFILANLTSAYANKDVYGISNSGTMGNITADVTASAAGYGTVYGVNSSGSLGDISGTITAAASSKSFSFSSYDGSAYGVYLGSGSSIGTISAAISATSGINYTGNSSSSLYGNAAAFYTGSAQDLIFAEGASLTATTEGTGNAYGLQFASGTKNDSINFGTGVDVSASATGTGNATAVYTYNYYGEVTVSLGDGAKLSASVTDESAQAFGVVSASSLRIEASGDASISATASSEDASTKAISANKTFTVATTGKLNITGDVMVNSGASDGAGMGTFTVEQGTVCMSSGSKVLADSITIDSGATLALVIAGDDTISSSSVTNNGTLSLSAGATLAADEYSLSSNSGLTVSGTVKTYGGTLSGNTFTVAEAKTLTLDGGTTETRVDANGRLVVSKDDTSIVMNFSSTTETTVSSVTTVTGETSITDNVTVTQSFAEFAAETMSGTVEIAEAYHFDVASLEAGESVELVFYVGNEVTADDIAIFHLADTEGSEWSTSDQLTNYSLSDGYLTVYTDGFSSIGYAISTFDGVPEPSTATLSLLALAGLCSRRRRRKA